MRPVLATFPLEPIWDGYLADPFLFFFADTYYVIGTGSPENPSSDSRRFPIISSSNLQDWTFLGHALDEISPECGDAYWAPEISYIDNTFYLYYSVGFDDKRHRLRVATSKTPAGPYVDTGFTLTDINETPFAIDPSPVQDRDGQWYLFYSRDFLDSDSDSLPGTAIVSRKMDSPTKLNDTESVILRATCNWQRFEENRLMYGKRYDWHTLEGAFVHYHEDSFYLFYSGGRWDSENYGVDVVSSTNLLGPYSTTAQDSRTLLLSSQQKHWIGPGHCSILAKSSRHNQMICFHAWNSDRTKRQPYISELDWI